MIYFFMNDIGDSLNENEKEKRIIHTCCTFFRDVEIYSRRYVYYQLSLFTKKLAASILIIPNN